jgi:hypothetical protein
VYKPGVRLKLVKPLAEGAFTLPDNSKTYVVNSIHPSDPKYVQFEDVYGWFDTRCFVLAGTKRNLPEWF